MFNSASLDAALVRLYEKKNLAGVSAAIMGPDGLLYSWNHGFIDRDGLRAPDCDTLFGIASMSKSITALCLCILAAEGRISLDDPVSDYVPSVSLPGIPPELVTLRSLMTHTSGLPPMEPLEWSIAMNSTDRPETKWLRETRAGAPNAMATLTQVTDYIAACPYPMLGAPGEVFSYSNEGYAILSYAVDAAAGMPLEDFMQERVFAPLGMTRSILDNGIEASRALSGGNITSLFEMEDGRRTCDDGWSILPPFRGCAMVKSTARDMATYYRMLSSFGMHEGRQAIPREAVELLCGRDHAASPIQRMACGINKRAHLGHIICEHAGGLHGVSTMGGLLLGEGIGFAVLCNQGDEDMSPLLWAMENAVMGRPLEESHQWFVPSGRAFSQPELLCGEYTDHEGNAVVMRVFLEAGSLFALRDGARYALRFCGSARFLAEKLGDAPDAIGTRCEFLLIPGGCRAMRWGTRVFLRNR